MWLRYAPAQTPANALRHCAFPSCFTRLKKCTQRKGQATSRPWKERPTPLPRPLGRHRRREHPQGRPPPQLTQHATPNGARSTQRCTPPGGRRTPARRGQTPPLLRLGAGGLQCRQTWHAHEATPRLRENSDHSHPRRPEPRMRRSTPHLASRQAGSCRKGPALCRATRPTQRPGDAHATKRHDRP